MLPSDPFYKLSSLTFSEPGNYAWIEERQGPWGRKNGKWWHI